MQYEPSGRLRIEAKDIVNWLMSEVAAGDPTGELRALLGRIVASTDELLELEAAGAEREVRDEAGKRWEAALGEAVRIRAERQSTS